MSMKAIVAILLLAIAGYTQAQMAADAFLRIPGEAVGNDKNGRMVICPIGSKPVNFDCEEIVPGKGKIAGLTPQETLDAHFQKRKFKYVGFTAEPGMGGGVVLYYKVK